MKRIAITIVIPVLCALAGGAVLAYWLLNPPRTGEYTLRTPASALAPYDLPVKPVQETPPENQPGGSAIITASPTLATPVEPPQVGKGLEGTYTKYSGAPAASSGVWANYRGAKFDGISTEAVALARAWAGGKPRELWSVTLGEGYAAPVIRNGRVYLLDYDQVQKMDAIRCFSFADGREIWRRAYPVDVKRNHGMSRTVSAVSDKYLVTLGPKCHVLCVDAQTGEYKWSIDLVRDYNTKVPEWYAGQCPIIEHDRVILAPGGKNLLMAVDCATGKVVWQTPNPKGWNMSHSSILPLEFGGKKMYVYPAREGVVGVSATDGSVLWEMTEWPLIISDMPMPVYVGDGKIFLARAYNAGATLIKLTPAGGKFKAEVVYTVKPREFGSDQQTPIFYKGYLYGVIPGGKLVCFDVNAGRQVWASDNTVKFGIGPYIIADGMLILLNDTGTLTLVEATHTGYKQLAQARVLNGHDAWGPLALVNGKLFARDLTRMVCLDMTK